MARYIDADALDNEVMHWFITITGNPKQHTVVNECKSSFRRMIDNQPTADVAPIVHGEWIGDTCSICNLDWNENMVNNSDDWGYFDQMPNYCPNCGAKMDGKDRAK